MNIVVTGSSGYIGSRLLRAANDLCEAVGTSRGGVGEVLPLELDSPATYHLERIGPDTVVFLLAGVSSPDLCTRDYDRVYQVNVVGTCRYVDAVTAKGGRVVFFSSDTVYGHKTEAFGENVVSSPVGKYGEMKHEVERRFASNPLFKSVRLSYVFSKDDGFTRYLHKLCATGEEADIFHPFYRSIVWRDDVIAGALSLARQWTNFAAPVINFGGPQSLSRLDFVKLLQQSAMPDLRFRVSEPDDAFFLSRPRVINMESPLLSKLLGRPASTIEDAIKSEFLQEGMNV
jgi:dTDP-4-dehydrorhamnose reductase